MREDKEPQISIASADAAFRETAMKLNLDPDGKWIGRYVEYVWRQDRPIIQAYLPRIADRSVLEFGCNVGATSVVLGGLGAQVTGVDIDPNWVALAELNARRHGVDCSVQFKQIPQGGELPFAPRSFDIITCCSVLEYVGAPYRAQVFAELDRVLRPGGYLIILGTASRLAPREVHSGRWFVNYLPEACDRLLGYSSPLQRGIWPGQIRDGFKHYQDLVKADKARAYINALRLNGTAPWKKIVLSSLALALNGRWSLGMCTPSIFMALRKPL